MASGYDTTDPAYKPYRTIILWANGGTSPRQPYLQWRSDAQQSRKKPELLQQGELYVVETGV